MLFNVCVCVFNSSFTELQHTDTQCSHKNTFQKEETLTPTFQRKFREKHRKHWENLRKHDLFSENLKTSESPNASYITTTQSFFDSIINLIQQLQNVMSKKL